jgi:hypothetical protein
MGKSRSERREASGILFNLYGPETALGFPVIGSTTTEQAAEKVACGSWREVIYTDGGFAGYQIVAKAKVVIRPRIDRALTITLSELQMNAGLFGRSHTKGMPEWKRLSRHARYDKEKILAPEDAIERAIEKVKLWPYPASRVDDGSGEPVFGDRAVRCYPKTK